MNSRPTKEPIRKPWIWIVLAIIMLAAIPWYLPAGSIGFVWMGIPAWMLISVVFTLIMCGYVSWLCFTQWDVVEGEEDDDRSSTEG
jgi:fatty acid desaturase